MKCLNLHSELVQVFFYCGYLLLILIIPTYFPNSCLYHVLCHEVLKEWMREEISQELTVHTISYCLKDYMCYYNPTNITFWCFWSLSHCVLFLISNRRECCPLCYGSTLTHEMEFWGLYGPYISTARIVDFEITHLWRDAGQLVWRGVDLCHPKRTKCADS